MGSLEYGAVWSWCCCRTDENLSVPWDVLWWRDKVAMQRHPHAELILLGQWVPPLLRCEDI